jgi:Uri superfamily endonuclease
VIPDTWEARTGGLQILGQPWQISKTMSQNEMFIKGYGCKDVWTCSPSMCKTLDSIYSSKKENKAKTQQIDETFVYNSV